METFQTSPTLGFKMDIITKTRPCNIRRFFMAVKMIICDIFLNFAQNIDSGYKLEPPHNLCFRAKKIRK